MNSLEKKGKRRNFQSVLRRRRGRIKIELGREISNSVVFSDCVAKEKKRNGTGCLRINEGERNEEQLKFCNSSRAKKCKNFYLNQIKMNKLNCVLISRKIFFSENKKGKN